MHFSHSLGVSPAASTTFWVAFSFSGQHLRINRVSEQHRGRNCAHANPVVKNGMQCGSVGTVKSASSAQYLVFVPTLRHIMNVCAGGGRYCIGAETGQESADVQPGSENRLPFARLTHSYTLLQSFLVQPHAAVPCDTRVQCVCSVACSRSTLHVRTKVEEEGALGVMPGLKGKGKTNIPHEKGKGKGADAFGRWISTVHQERALQRTKRNNLPVW